MIKTKHKYKFKYASNATTSKGVQPQQWHTGKDPVTHEKYYAFLKHRAQAKFRGETYQLTWPEWRKLWSRKYWSKRGRSPRSICLSMKDKTQGWCVGNLKFRQRGEHMSEVAHLGNQARRLKYDRSL
jgi:hypothetical protein